MYILGKNQPHDRSIHRRQFESIWRTSTISDLWPCGLICRVTNSFFSLSFFVFSSTSILNCSIFFFLEKGFWFRFCPRQLTTNCPTQLQRGKPWVKEIPYGNVSRNAAVLILKQILCKANSSRVLIRKSRLGFFLLDKQHKSNFICTNQYNKNSGNYQPKIQFHVPYIRHYKVTLLICLKNASPTIFS